MRPPGRRLVALVLAAVTPALVGRPAAAQVTAVDTPLDGVPAALRRAHNAWLYGEYATCRRSAEAVAGELRTGDVVLVPALELAGVCAAMEGDSPAARALFVRLLALRPDHRLDPVYVPPAVMELFEATRAAPPPPAAPAAEPEAAPPRTVLRTERIVRTSVEKPLWTLFVPFGVGQFQNGHTAAGASFAAGELAALAVNVGAFWALRAAADADGRYPADRHAEAAALRVTQFAALGAFVALVLAGVIDAWVRRVPAEIVETRGIEPDPGPQAVRDERALRPQR